VFAAKAQLAKYLRTRQTRHHQVEQHDVCSAAIKLGDSAGAVRRLDDLKALPGEHVGQRLPVGLLVLHHKHPGHRLISWGLTSSGWMSWGLISWGLIS